MQSGNRDYDSARLSYHIDDKVNEMGVEMVYVKEQIRTYLEVHSQTIPPYQNHLNEALVRLKIGENEVSAVAYRHAGGQRLSLPQDLQMALIEALESGTAVTVALDGFLTTLQPADFTKAFAHLKSSPIKNPLRLPL